MNLIEEWLRDAYHGATQTVRPDTIRGLDEQAATITGRHRKAPSRVLYWTAPLAAAVAVVVVIGIVLGLRTRAPVAPPAHHPQPTHHTKVVPAGSPAERFFTAVSNGSRRIYIINATSGVTVASIAPSYRWDFFGTPSTGDGVTYVVPTWEPGHCGSTRLEEFTLNSSGQPGPLTELTRLRHLVSHLWMSDQALSADGSTLAFFANTCVSRFVAVNPHIGVIKLATGRLTNWTTPDKSIEYPMSLTRNGRLLEYNVGGAEPPGPSAVYLMPTNAAAGPVANVSRTLVTGANVGSDVTIQGATITQDGAAVYLFTRPTSLGQLGITSFEFRKINVATGRIKLIGSYHTDPVWPFAVDPAGRRTIGSTDGTILGAQAIMIDLRTGRGRLLDPSQWQPNNGGYAW